MVFIQNLDTWSNGMVTPLHCQLMMSCHTLTQAHPLSSINGRPPKVQKVQIAQFLGQFCEAKNVTFCL